MWFEINYKKPNRKHKSFQFKNHIIFDMLIKNSNQQDADVLLWPICGRHICTDHHNMGLSAAQGLYSKRHLNYHKILRKCEAMAHMMLEVSSSSEIWQDRRQEYPRGACKISERPKHFNT